MRIENAPTLLGITVDDPQIMFNKRELHTLRQARSICDAGSELFKSVIGEHYLELEEPTERLFGFAAMELDELIKAAENIDLRIRAV